MAVWPKNKKVLTYMHIHLHSGTLEMSWLVTTDSVPDLRTMVPLEVSDLRARTIEKEAVPVIKLIKFIKKAVSVIKLLQIADIYTHTNLTHLLSEKEHSLWYKFPPGVIRKDLSVIE